MISAAQTCMLLEQHSLTYSINKHSWDYARRWDFAVRRQGHWSAAYKVSLPPMLSLSTLLPSHHEVSTFLPPGPYHHTADHRRPRLEQTWPPLNRRCWTFCP